MKSYGNAQQRLARIGCAAELDDEGRRREQIRVGDEEQVALGRARWYGGEGNGDEAEVRTI